MDASSVGDEWNSGEALTVTLIDQDLNKNTASSEDLLLVNTTNGQLVPSLQIGSPLSVLSTAADINSVSNYSKIAYYTNASIFHTVGNTANFTIHTGYTGAQMDAIDTVNTYFNYDFTGFTNSTNPVLGVCLTAGSVELACDAGNAKGIKKITSPSGQAGALKVQLKMTQDYGLSLMTDTPLVADIFSYGDGVNNAIYRLELTESDADTGNFGGTIEYKMLNQININLDTTYTDLTTVGEDIDIIIEQDMTDEDSPRVNYYDLGADGVQTQIADQLEAPTHSGVVSLDSDNYKIADTVTVTLEDQDMNTDSSLIDVYTTIAAGDVVGSGNTLANGLVLDITFDDLGWVSTENTGCVATGEAQLIGDNGLYATGFTLVETDTASGIFTGSFQVPTTYCNTTDDTIVTVTGTDIEVNYQDYRNASGESIEVGDGASINANTGSVALIEQFIQYLMVQFLLTLTITRLQILLL
jgi:hypothetical protein